MIRRRSAKKPVGELNGMANPSRACSGGYQQGDREPRKQKGPREAGLSVSGWGTRIRTWINGVRAIPGPFPVIYRMLPNLPFLLLHQRVGASTVYHSFT